MVGRRVTRAALLGAAASLSAAMVTDAAEMLPNLRPAAPIGLHVGPSDAGGGAALRFDTTTWNVSDNHLDLLGIPAGSDEAIASQCLSWGPTTRTCLERAEVGRFVFHPDHAHFHFDDYAAYELRRMGSDGAPDFSEAGLLGTGGKVSFCLMDTDRSGSAPGDPAGSTPFYLACYAGHQGISARWGDTYTAGLVGQEIPLRRDLAPGKYAVVIHVNPEGFLREADHDDNIAWTTFTWTGDQVVRPERHDDVPRGRLVNPVVLGPGAGAASGRGADGA